MSDEKPRDINRTRGISFSEWVEKNKKSLLNSSILMSSVPAAFLDSLIEENERLSDEVHNLREQLAVAVEALEIYQRVYCGMNDIDVADKALAKLKGTKE